jgi:carbon monoxide dehydrogenase subunit G
MKIEDSFEVNAPIEETWALLNDVPAVIPCMPGAELVEVRGDDEWLARLATKVGPIAMNFDTEVTRTKADDGAHSVDLKAKAKELKGRGRANAKISSSLVAEGTGTKVSIVTDLQMQGPLAQFGRGVVGEISAQMTREFANCLAARLDSPVAAAAATGAGGAEPAGAGATPPPAPQAKPINGLRLFFSALGRWFVGLFKRGGRS